MKTFSVSVLSICTLVLANSLLFSGETEEEKKPSKEPVAAEKVDVKKLMQAAHKGKDAPLTLIRAEVKKESPDWKLIASKTAPLVKLSGEIKDNVSYTSRPGPYVAGVKALKAATAKEDTAKARLAVDALMKSCAGCHRD